MVWSKLRIVEIEVETGRKVEGQKRKCSKENCWKFLKPRGNSDFRPKTQRLIFAI